MSLVFFLQRDRADGTGYEYALGWPEIVETEDGPDVVVAAGWGPMEALTWDAPLDEQTAATAAGLLGCNVTIIAPPAEAVPPPPPPDPAAARRARVAAYLAEQEQERLRQEAAEATQLSDGLSEESSS